MKQKTIYLFSLLFLAGQTLQSGIPTDRRKRISSYPFVTGDTFRNFSDHIYDETDEKMHPKKVKRADTVFVQIGLLGDFFKKIHPKIKHPYILISHNHHHCAPGPFKKYLNDEKIIAWFTKNPSMTHPKLFPIPLGLANKYWSHGDINVVKKFMYRSLSIIDTKKKMLLYLNIATNTNKEKRLPAYNHLKNKRWCTQGKRCKYPQYLHEMAQHKFIASPLGAGPDCHRHWEALLVGAIPIVDRSSIDEVFEGLPVLIIDNWKTITPAFLEKEYKELSSKKYDRQQLFADYWFGKIRAIQQAYR